MSKLLALTLACLALSLGAVACGDDDSGDGGDSGGAAATTERTAPDTSAGDGTETGDGTEAGGGGGAGGAESVDIVDIDYEPRSVTVPAGTTVTWTNTGDLPHTVTKEDGPGPDFDSGTLDPGDTYERTFETAGTIDYVCTIHAGQRGSVTVR